MDERKYRNIVKAIKNSSKIDYNFQNFLLQYINGVKNGTRVNDFVDFDILSSVVMKFVNGEIEIDSNRETYERKFKEFAMDINFYLPEGEETEDFVGIKQALLRSNFEPGKEFYSIFENRHDYEQIANIIKSDPVLLSRNDEIVDYALEVSPYCINQGVLKREILSYMQGLKNVTGNVSEYSKTRLIEAKKRSGVYPLDERQLALLSENARRAEALIKQLENMQARVEGYDERVKLATSSGIKAIEDVAKSSISSFKNIIEEEKKAIIARLEEYELELQKSLKNSSDEMFNKILEDTQKKVKNVKVLAQSINNTTTQDLLRIKQAAEDSVSALQEYMQNEPEFRKIIADAAKSATLKEALLENGFPTATVQGATKANVVQMPGIDVSNMPSIIIPGFDKQIIPDNQRVEIPAGQIREKLIEAFDESIPFEKRIEKIMKEKERRIKNGELFHEIFDEVLVDVIEGDWVYLYGPSGCGKTYIFEQVAELLGLDFAENGPITNVQSVMAYTDPHGRFRATQAFIALLYGKLLSFDELDNGNADTQVAIRVLYDEMKKTIDNPKNKRYVTFAETLTVPVNPNFRMIAAGNTTGDGENEVHSAREKMDEAIQQRLTPKKFNYDSRLESRIFGNYESWYSLFKLFREACDDYAREQGFPDTPGMVTTRDASSIVKYLDHNSKNVDWIIREQFTQKKDLDYLRAVSDYIKRKYPRLEDLSEPISSNIKASSVDEKSLVRSLVYCCNNPRN